MNLKTKIGLCRSYCPVNCSGVDKKFVLMPQAEADLSLKRILLCKDAKAVRAMIIAPKTIQFKKNCNCSKRNYNLNQNII